MPDNPKDPEVTVTPRAEQIARQLGNYDAETIQRLIDRGAIR